MTVNGAYNGFETASAGAVPQRRIAIAAGGTAGHVTTGLAIARAYEQLAAGVSVLFLGTGGELEARLANSYGYHLETLSASPLVGRPLSGKVSALWNLSAGIREARALLKSHGTGLVIGLGGYASPGVLLAARSLGLRSVIHEANAIPGLANRLVARFVDRVYLGYPAARAGFPTPRCRVTGIPVRAEFAQRPPRRVNGNDPRRGAIHVFVTGGSQGSAFMNRRIPGLIRRLSETGLAIDVQHQTGDWDPDPVRAAYERAGIDARVERYVPDMKDAYARARFVIACPGAATLAELSAYGVPSLLVPRADSAADHQIANAAAFSERTGNDWVREQDWDEKHLVERIGSLLRDPNALAVAERRTRRFSQPRAAQLLVRDCERMMAGAWPA